MSEKIYTDEEKIKRLTAWHESEKAEIAALRSQLATVTAEREAMREALEEISSGRFGKSVAVKNIARAALKGGKG